MGFDPSKENQRMARKRLKPEETVAKLRQVEILQSQGMAAAADFNELRRLDTCLLIWFNAVPDTRVICPRS